ncbi:hypothetical protein BT69DRAFT_1305144 [Atractiella rhizophila]|nr:hypothetical protein BT69DRAFT_1305144 [Atractiella rhizophila]
MLGDVLAYEDGNTPSCLPHVFPSRQKCVRFETCLLSSTHAKKDWNKVRVPDPSHPVVHPYPVAGVARTTVGNCGRTRENIDEPEATALKGKPMSRRKHHARVRRCKKRRKNTRHASRKPDASDPSSNSEASTALERSHQKRLIKEAKPQKDWNSDVNKYDARGYLWNRYPGTTSYKSATEGKFSSGYNSCSLLSI